MFAIFKKELRSYFINAIGYVYVGVFLAAAALLCCYTTIGSNSYNTATYFTYMLFSFIVLIPLLTMKLFSEEKKLRTEQLLMTAPISTWSMILGKFLAAFVLFVGTVAVSCVNFIPIYVYGSIERDSAGYADSFNRWTDIHIGPQTASLLACLLGIVLVGAAFISIGLFISSLTENQLAAAIITVAILFGMLILDIVNPYISVYAVRFVIDWFCVVSRFANFSAGILDYSAILYYLSITGVFLMLTVRVYERRRWA